MQPSSHSQDPSPLRPSKETGDVFSGDGLGTKATVPTPLVPQIRERRLYVAEIVEKAPDVVYHFWPPKGTFEFPFGEQIFGMLLEDAFVWGVGDGISAEADYFDRKVAQHFSRGDDPKRPLGQPTFWVKLANVANRPGAQKILVDRILGRLDTLLDDASGGVLKVGKVEYYRQLRSRRPRS